MRVSWPDRYNSEQLVCGIDWSERMEDGESIQTLSFTAIDGSDVVLSSEVVDAQTTKVTVNGGSVGTHWVLCQITTSGGKILEEIATFQVKRES